jgi:hypothetical protein
MATKRLTIELSTHQYEILQREAKTAGTTISGCIRMLIVELRSRPKDQPFQNNQEDPLYKRRGSFDGPKDLAEHHDRYLYR